MDIFQSDRFKSSLGNISRSTDRLSRIMKNDARLRSRDYGRISELNRRLNRVIPIIPGMLGIAGYRFGMMREGSMGFPLPPFSGIPPFPGFPSLPPRPPRPPGPTDGPTTGAPVFPPLTPPPIIKEEVEEPQVTETPVEEPAATPPIKKDDEFDPGKISEILEDIYGIPAEEPKTPEILPVPVREPAKPKDPEKEGEEEADVPVPAPTTTPTTPPFFPSPIKVPEPVTPADVQEDIQGMTQLFYEQPAFSRGLLGNLFPVEPKIFEREDGFVIVLSENPQQAGQNPFMPRKKLPPQVTVLSPEQVTQLKNSDMAKAAQIFDITQNVMEILGAAYTLRPRQGRAPMQPLNPASRVTRSMVKNAIRRFRRQQTQQQPQLPGSSPTQPLLPESRSDSRSRTGDPVVDVTPTASQTVRRGDRGGILEVLGSGSARRAKKSFSAQEREALKDYDNRQLFDIVNDRMMPKSTRDAAQDLLNRDMQRNVLNDPTAQQGPLGPQASATTVIQPIIIFKDPPTA
tara:strand:+ start:7290 stop:8834 length:1545 start_codon:yes stop_codon:yes gene_type:complete